MIAGFPFARRFMYGGGCLESWRGAVSPGEYHDPVPVAKYAETKRFRSGFEFLDVLRRLLKLFGAVEEYEVITQQR